MNPLYSAIIIVASLCIVAEAQTCALSSVCKNGGTCRVVNGKDTCECLAGYFDVVCGSYASSVEIVLGDEKTGNWFVALKDFNVITVSELSRTRLSYRVTYNKTYNRDDLTQIRQLLSREEKVTSVADFNECSNGNPCVGEHNRCANTEGSFQCLCESGYKISNDKCVQEVDNTKKTIYIWSGVVSVLVLWMICLVCFINIRKMRRGKKLQKIAREREEIENQKQLNPTNLQTLQVGTLSRSRVDSPLSSVFGDHPASSYARSDAPLYTGGAARNNPSRMSAPELMGRSPDSYYAGDFTDGMGPYPGKRYAQSLCGIEEIDAQALDMGYPAYPHVNGGYEESFQNIPRPYFPEKAVIPTFYGEQCYNSYDQES